MYVALDPPRTATEAIGGAMAEANVRPISTVVVTDLCDVGPDSTELRGRWRDAARDIAARCGGAVTASEGDRVVAVFGGVGIHEHDAAGAIEASFELRRAAAAAHGAPALTRSG